MSVRGAMAARFRNAIALAGIACSGPAMASPTLEAGWGHNLAVVSGQVWAWGDNLYGALGNGTTVSAAIPVRAGSLTGVVAVSAGRNFSLAVRNDGTVWSWGTGGALGYDAPELCDTTVPCSRVPRQIAGLAGVVAVAAGHRHALALKSDGTVVAWGNNALGKLGIGSTTNQVAPVAIGGLTGVTAIAAAESHSVALKSDGTVATWGANAYNELGVTVATNCLGNPRYGGLGSQPCSLTPVSIPHLFNIASISAKGRHTLALTSGGTLYAWGSSHYGQLGQGTDADSTGPVTVPGMTGIQRMAAGFAHSMAVKSDGTYWSWGLNLFRRLGVPDTQEACQIWSCRRSPTRGSTHDAAASLVGGGAHSLAVRANGTIDAFGYGASGQLGTGTPTAFTRYADVDPDGDSGQGAAGTGISVGRASAAGALNLSTLDDGIDFGALVVGAASPSQELRVFNYGTGALTVSSLSTTGDFTHTTTCSTTLAAGAECAVFVSFQPATAGIRTGTLLVQIAESGAAPATIDLQGAGIGVPQALFVSKSGSGKVTSSPTGIDCGVACSASFDFGTPVTLSAAPANGFSFAGWSGSCSGSGACIVTMDASRSVGATFVAIPPPASANLSVTHTGAPSPAFTAKDVVYTITVSNAGPATATNVVLTDLMPAGTAFIWAHPGCTRNAGTVTCPIGSLASGASVQRKIVVRPPIAGSITNTATVSGTEPDSDTANNASNTTITVSTSPAGVAVQRYRLFSPVTLEHLYTTDLNEYNVLGSFVGTWVQEGTVGKVLNNPGAFGGVTATPYYRLYNTANAQHHWTTDANEHYTLILFPQYNSEGVDGYILPTQAPGSVPLYRLLYPFSVPVAGLHHWTIDPTEYGQLISAFGWVGEGGSGYVIP